MRDDRLYIYLAQSRFSDFAQSDTGYLVQYLVLFVLFTEKSKYFSTFLQYKYMYLYYKSVLMYWY